MASLKEIKGRIASVNSTLKITSAMKMVASAKLHKAQERIEGMLPYEQQLARTLRHFLQTDAPVRSPFTEQREVERTALVVFSSNTSLCGGFNANVVRKLHDWLHAHGGPDAKDRITIYPVGRKVADVVRKCGYEPAGDYTHMAEKPNYAEAGKLADELAERFLSGDVDRIEVLYHHFKSAGVQELLTEVYLPLDISQAQERQDDSVVADYIVEPSKEALLQHLLPEVLKIRIYTLLLDSNASEHAARSMAMQTATDNANNLIQDLTVMYNKGRQQAITNELLDIVGGTMA